MSEIKDYTLTTLSRVKDRLQIERSGFDAFLERLINAATDLIESECGGRRFKRTTYANEVYSVYGQCADFVALKNSPVIALTSFQYRAGTLSTPSWTDFIVSEYELTGDGSSGLIKVYGGVPRGVNAVRVTYTAGYLIDFNDSTNTAKHTLPSDLTDLCERLVVKLFKKRDAEGKASEAFEGNSITWERFINTDDRSIINRYKRVPQFV